MVIDQHLAQRLSFEWVQHKPWDVGDLLRPMSRRSRPIQDAPTTTDPREAQRWNADQHVRVGDTLRVTRLFRTVAELEVVGIVRQPFGGKPNLFLALSTMQRIARAPGALSRIDIVLNDGVDPESIVDRRGGELGPDVQLQTTAKVTSGLNDNMRSSQFGFVLASVLSAMSAAFIILTGLNTAVSEQQREMAIMRCVGGTRVQIALAQLVVGLLVAVVGTAVGIPIGIGFSWLLWLGMHDQLGGGLVIPPGGLVLAAGGSMVAGLLGAAWPAYRASRMSPLAALGSRAAVPGRRGIAITTGLGLLGLAIQLLIVSTPSSGQIVFWGYATVGLPLMFIGYFLLSVPVVLLVARLSSPVISRALRLPRSMLARTVYATPYRHGFTAGAMMGGLALMISIWTNGGSILRDWLGKLDFPDAFVSGLALSPECQAALDELPFIENTCAITLKSVQTSAFGVKALQSYRTHFIAFEPDRFFEMTSLEWIEGDEQTARERLNEGGAVIVSREFLVAQGMGVGDTFTCSDPMSGRTHDFAIVGVITSPGLEVISKFFNIGREFHQQAVHAVFGTRADLKERFGSEVINLVQIDLKDHGPDAVDDATAIAQIRRAMLELNAGVADVGSGREIKRQITFFATGMLVVFSAVAVMAMLVACFGVANLVVASIEARRFEFGVLRAVGGTRGLLIRLVLAETLLVAITSCVLGTLMGMQGSYAGQRLYALLLGLALELRPPWLAIAAGWAIVALLTLAAAYPAIWRLGRTSPRALLSATKG